MCDMFPQVEETINEEISPELISLGPLNNGIRPMKWHIFNTDETSEAYNCPLCWNEPAIEFDSKEAAQRFFESVLDAFDPEYTEFSSMEIKECIFYYDGGYINLSNYIVVHNGDTDELKEVGPIVLHS